MITAVSTPIPDPYKNLTGEGALERSLKAPSPDNKKVEDLEKEKDSSGDSSKKEDVGRLLSEHAKVLQTFNPKIRFEIDDVSKKIVAKVIDSENETVIREIPLDEIMRYKLRPEGFRGGLVNLAI